MHRIVSKFADTSDNTDIPSIGKPIQLQCTICDHKFGIEVLSLTSAKKYLHPHYDDSWENKQHPYHNLKYICPNLIKYVLKIMQKLACPKCKFQGIFKPIDDSINKNLILISLKVKNFEYNRYLVYYCEKCNQEFSTKRTFVSKQKVLCADCQLTSE